MALFLKKVLKFSVYVFAAWAGVVVAGFGIAEHGKQSGLSISGGQIPLTGLTIVQADHEGSDVCSGRSCDDDDDDDDGI